MHVKQLLGIGVCWLQMVAGSALTLSLPSACLPTALLQAAPCQDPRRVEGVAEHDMPDQAEDIVVCCRLQLHYCVRERKGAPCEESESLLPAQPPCLGLPCRAAGRAVDLGCPNAGSYLVRTFSLSPWGIRSYEGDIRRRPRGGHCRQPGGSYSGSTAGRADQKST